ncbi:MAG: hypothetical protein ACI9TY_000148 [Alphaproteobacteria bacterium]|jgi:hypothetical protein
MAEILGITICLGVLLFYFFAGRIIATHTLFGRNYAAAGLHNIFSAIGVWYFIALIATILEIKLNIAWWIFTSIIVILYFYFLSSRHEKLPREHTLTVPLTILLFLVPAFYFVSADAPSQIQELLGYLRNSQYTASHFNVANSDASAAYGLEKVTSPQAGLLALLPAYILNTTFFSSSFAIFNVLLLAFVADTMVKLTDINVRWSNLALVSAGSVFALTVLNPFFSLETLTIANADFIFAAAILTAMVPLCREKSLPLGLGAIPAALILSVITGMHEMGVYAAIIIVSLWMIRKLFEEKTFTDSFFTLTVLIALPALSWHLWAFYAQDIELAKISTYLNTDIIYIVKDSLSAFELLTLTAMLILLLIEIVSVRSYKDFKNLFTHNAWITLPTLFTCAYILVSIFSNENGFANRIQFIAVVPFWYIATSWYKNSKWRKFAYESPWALALSLAIVFMSFQSIASTSLKQRLNDPQQHTSNVATLLKENILAESDNLAILESTADSQLYSAFMRYGLTEHKGKVLNANKILASSSLDLDIFFLKLKEEGFNYLWVHSPTERDKKWLGRFLKSDKSYLFKVNSDKLSLIRIYPHPSYDYKSL